VFSVIKIDSSLSIMRVIFRNDCPLLRNATRRASPQSQYQLISNALTSSGTVRATRSKGIVISAPRTAREKKEKEKEQKGETFRVLSTPFLFCNQTKISRRKASELTIVHFFADGEFVRRNVRFLTRLLDSAHRSFFFILREIIFTLHY